MLRLVKLSGLDSQGSIVAQGVDLSDSFILGWHRSSSSFVIELLLSLWPESPFYSKPELNEYTCYKRGQLTFTGVRVLLGFLDLAGIKPSVDPNGSKDWDCIYNFRRVGNRYKFSTEFTDIEVESTEVELRLV